MSDSIEAIKSSSSCVDLFRRFWPSHYRERGNVRCPWHEDQKPSAQLDRDCFYCHACGYKYDAVDLYQHGAGVNRKEAIKLLCDELGISGNGTGNHLLSRKRTKAPNPKHKSSNEFFTAWNKLCKNTFTPEATDYIEGARQIKGLLPDLLKSERIAFDPKFKAWNHETQSKDLWRAIAFPLVDAGKQEMLGIQYVRIDGKGKKFATGTNGKDCFFFYGTGNEYCVVTEAVIDGLSVYAACSRTLDLSVCSIMSGGKGYEEKLTRLQAQNPVLFFDNDDAGRKITDASVKLLNGKCRLVDWSLAPAGMKDCNDLLKAGHADVIERMVRTSRIPTEEEIREQDTDADRLKRRLEELNREYAVVMLGGECAIVQHITDHAFNRPDVRFLHFDSFRRYYGNERYLIENGNGQKRVDVAKLWIDQPNRTQYKGIVFNPSGDVPEYLNLWRGFSVEPKKGECERFKEHLFETISNRNDEIFYYWLAWMADCVQHPGGPRPGTSIVMRGRQGVGKGAVANYFGGIFGIHFLHLTQSKKLLGNFNFHLKNALLIFADEAFWAGDRSAEGTLRNLVTEDIVWIEPKGKDSFHIKNHIRVLIASNNEWVIPAGMQERRFFVIDVNDTRQQDHEYFKKLYEEMNNGGREALLHELLNLDISNINLREFPQTEALFDQKIATMTTHEKFWFECLKRGSIQPDGTYWEDFIKTRELYNLYLGFCEQMGDRYPKTDSQLSKKLRELCPGVMQTRPRSDESRGRGYQFPGLVECRDQMEKILKYPVDWG